MIDYEIKKTINIENTVNTQVKLEVEETDCKLQEAKVIICKMEKKTLNMFFLQSYFFFLRKLY